MRRYALLSIERCRGHVGSRNVRLRGGRVSVRTKVDNRIGRKSDISEIDLEARTVTFTSGSNNTMHVSIMLRRLPIIDVNIRLDTLVCALN